MDRVVVVTDSSATVPQHLARELDIRVVPIILTINSRTYHDGVDITAAELYRRLRSAGPLPTTASPSVGDFLRVYVRAAQEASGILSIHMSSGLSGTLNAATTASQLVDGPPIHVLDSRTAAIAQGFVAIEAARTAATGAPLEAVEERAREISSRVALLATLGTLEYLHRGGRIGGAAALFGTVLQIKPVLSVADTVTVFAKPRTQSRAIKTILEQMEKVTAGRPVHAAILHADVPDEAEMLRQVVAERFECVELYMTELTPVMGAHTGPGVLGVAFFAE